jgi:hypothetical protein
MQQSGYVARVVVHGLEWKIPTVALKTDEQIGELKVPQIAALHVRTVWRGIQVAIKHEVAVSTVDLVPLDRFGYRVIVREHSSRTMAVVHKDALLGKGFDLRSNSTFHVMQILAAMAAASSNLFLCRCTVEKGATPRTAVLGPVEVSRVHVVQHMDTLW